MFIMVYPIAEAKQSLNMFSLANSGFFASSGSTNIMWMRKPPPDPIVCEINPSAVAIGLYYGFIIKFASKVM